MVMVELGWSYLKFKRLSKNGFIYETFHYNSLTEEIDSVAKKLNERIKKRFF